MIQLDQHILREIDALTLGDRIAADLIARGARPAAAPNPRLSKLHSKNAGVNPERTWYNCSHRIRAAPANPPGLPAF